MSDNAITVKRLGVKLDPTVNYGHLLSATVFLVTAVTAWANLSNRQDEADRRIQRLERSQEQMTIDNTRESAVIARLEEKLSSLDRVLIRIERILDADAQRRGTTSPPPTRGG